MRLQYGLAPWFRDVRECVRLNLEIACCGVRLDGFASGGRGVFWVLGCGGIAIFGSDHVSHVSLRIVVLFDRLSCGYSSTYTSLGKVSLVSGMVGCNLRLPFLVACFSMRLGLLSSLTTERRHVLFFPPCLVVDIRVSCQSCLGGWQLKVGA